MDALRSFYNMPSFWQIMNIARKEVSHSKFITYYLNQDNHHSLGPSFLIKFFQLIAINAINQNANINSHIVNHFINSNEFEIHKVNIEEYICHKNVKGRFDIFINGSLNVRANGDDKSDFVIVIENKISAKETKNNGTAQTEIYHRFIKEKYPEHYQIFVLLSPYRETIVEDKSFISVTYQDLLTNVIEPLVRSAFISEVDKTRLIDYIKCLSQPALEEATNHKNKTTIMAMGEQERNLLLAFWAKNEDLIKACMSAISTSEEFPEKARKIATNVLKTNFQRDTTKYYLGDPDGPKLSRSAIVPRFIESWSSLDKEINTVKLSKDDVLEILRDKFPRTLRGGKNPTTEIIFDTNQSDEKNFSMIKIGDYEFYVASNIWTSERFDLFLNHAKALSVDKPELKILKA